MRKRGDLKLCCRVKLEGVLFIPYLGSKQRTVLPKLLAQTKANGEKVGDQEKPFRSPYQSQTQNGSQYASIPPPPSLPLLLSFVADREGEEAKNLDTSNRRMSTESSMTPADPVPRRKNTDALSWLANRNSRAPASVWTIITTDSRSSRTTVHAWPAKRQITALVPASIKHLASSR